MIRYYINRMRRLALAFVRTIVFFLSFSILHSPFSILSAQGLFRNQPLPSVIPSTQRNFSIPFEVRPDASADPPKEIELLVSTDLGVRWSSVARLPVDGKRFDFQAPSDGEYCFAFRTITLSGQTRQSGQGGPQIRVLVDATPPALTLEARQQPSGQMLVHWKVEEKNLQGKRPDFAVACVSFEPERRWVTLNVDSRYQQTSDSEIGGSFQFWPENGASEIEIRATIADAAGNRGEKTTSVRIKPVDRAPEELFRELPDSPNAAASAVPVAANIADDQTDAIRQAPVPSSQVPLTPPKPTKVSQRPPREKPKTPAPSPQVETTLAKQYQPAPSLLSPTGEPAKEAPAAKTETEKAGMEKTKAGDDLSRQLLANMDRFFDGRLSNELERDAAKPPRRLPSKAEEAAKLTQGPTFPGSAKKPVLPSLPSPGSLSAESHPAVAENRAAMPPMLPGGISGISLNTASPQAQVIVKWNIGDVRWTSAQIDILRAAAPEGPWMPITTNLPNTGEYWWYISPDDLKPFHIMIRIRGALGSYDDATRSPIRIDPKLLRAPF